MWHLPQRKISRVRRVRLFSSRLLPSHAPYEIPLSSRDVQAFAAQLLSFNSGCTNGLPNV